MAKSNTETSGEWDVEPKDSQSLIPRVESEEEDLPLDHEELAHMRKPSSRPFMYRIWWLQPVIILTLCILLTIETYEHRVRFHAKCVENLTAHSPLLKASFAPYETKYFNGTFLFPSIWRGQPSPQVDEAWNNLVDAENLVPVSDDDLVKMGKDPQKQVRIPLQLQEKYGEGAIGTTEYAHQLHCLNLIRKYTYFDYYSAKGDDIGFTVGDQILRTHIDHCIEMLRQVLMCNADTGVYTYNWIAGRPSPMPDFNVRHKCKDFAAIKAWTAAHKIPQTVLRRQPGEFVYATPP